MDASNVGNQQALAFPIDGMLAFDLSYDEPDERIGALYRKSKTQQWNADLDIDWDQPVDHDNPLAYDDRFLPIYGSRYWEQAGEKDRGEIRRQYHAYSASQFLHGEQAALIAAGRLIEVLPNAAGKQFAAAQAADEARHVEVFSRLLSEKLHLSYGIDDGLHALIEQGLTDSRWDFVVLTTQVLIEGLALGALQQLRDFSKNPLVCTIGRYVMADEARHVSYGVHLLAEHIPCLTNAEVRERMEFVSDGLHALRRRLNPGVVWRAIGCDTTETNTYVAEREPMFFRKLFFQLNGILEKVNLRREI